MTSRGQDEGVLEHLFMHSQLGLTLLTFVTMATDGMDTRVTSSCLYTLDYHGNSLTIAVKITYTIHTPSYCYYSI